MRNSNLVAIASLVLAITAAAVWLWLAREVVSTDQSNAVVADSIEALGRRAGPESLSAARRPIKPASAVVSVVDDERRPIAGAALRYRRDDAIDESATVATTGANGVAEVEVSGSGTTLAIVAAGFLENAVTVSPASRLEVRLQRALALRVLCSDLQGRAVAGVRMAISQEPLPDDWHSGVDAASRLASRGGRVWVATSTDSGVIDFVALPGMVPYWKILSVEHALLGGPGISDQEPFVVPGTYGFRFAPLMASGFRVKGDRVVSVVALRVAAGNLSPTDRSGTKQSIDEQIRATYPDVALLELFASRDGDVPPSYEVDVILERNGRRTLPLDWLPVASFLNRGPQLFEIDAAAGSNARFAGRYLIRLLNPDGSELGGRNIILNGTRTGGPILLKPSGEEHEGPIGKFLVQPQDAVIQSCTPRGMEIEITSQNRAEAVLQMTRQLCLVRFVRPPESSPKTVTVKVKSAAGKGTVHLIHGNEDYVDVVLPEMTFTATGSYPGCSKKDVAFDVHRLSAGDKKLQSVQLPD